MLDVFKVADLLVVHTIERWGDQVDLIGCYGSRVRGTAGPRSDLDLFYTPAEGKKPPATRTVLIEGILFDFWTVPWERLEEWAVGGNGGWTSSTGAVRHAKLLHVRSEEHAARFAALQQRSRDLLKPEARARMVRRALDEFRTVLAQLGNIRLALAGGDLSDARHAGWRLILGVRECLALANQRFVDQGGMSFLEQLALLPARPAELEPLIVTISGSSDPVEIAAAAEHLTLSTRAVLRELQMSLPPAATVEAQFKGSYPETNCCLGKILTMCESARPVDASLAAWFAQQDQSLMLSALESGAGHGGFNLYHEFASKYREIGLPELMRSRDPDELVGLTGEFDRRTREWLEEQSLSLCEFATLEEFGRSLKAEEQRP